jgi:hypothetical protein
MPETTIETTPRETPQGPADGLSWLVQEKLGERRFYALVTAIRAHEAQAREASDLSDADRDLYRQLRQTCEEL